MGAAPASDAAAPTISTVVVGTDGSPTATRALEFAIELAARYGSQLVVASSYEPVPGDRVLREQEEAPRDIRWSINRTEDVEATLRDAEGMAKARGLRVTSEARTGKPAAVLCELAEEHSADVLVVGSKGMHRKHLASVPNTVSHEAPCSVVVVKTV